MRKPNQKKSSRYLAVYLQKRQAQAKDGELPSLEELEGDYMNYVLEITNNDPVATAEILDVSPAQMFRRIKKIDVWI
jgi:DNA-binding NtrC family response regulator